MRKNLMKWEIDNGYQSKVVAAELGITESKWSSIKRGRLKPSYEVLKKFDELFQPEDIITLFAEE